MTWILASDWFRQITFHMTWIMASYWSRQILWPYIFRHSDAPQPWVVGKSLNDSLEEVKMKCDSEEGSNAPPKQGWRYPKIKFYFCVNFKSFCFLFAGACTTNTSCLTGNRSFWLADTTQFYWLSLVNDGITHFSLVKLLFITLLNWKISLFIGQYWY